jgi:hypothetical protein
VRIATSMTSLRVNVLETVLVPLITELLRLAKEHSAPALITNSIFHTNLQTTFFLIGTRVCIHRSHKKFPRHLCALSKDDLYVCIAIFQAKRQHRYRNPGGGEARQPPGSRSFSPANRSRLWQLSQVFPVHGKRASAPAGWGGRIRTPSSGSTALSSADLVCVTRCVAQGTARCQVVIWRYVVPHVRNGRSSNHRYRVRDRMWRVVIQAPIAPNR